MQQARPEQAARRAQGWYDCVGMGAIPVLFDAAQLEMWPFQHALNPAEFVAYVPRALAMSEGFNIVDYLAARFPVRLPGPQQAHGSPPPCRWPLPLTGVQC